MKREEFSKKVRLSAYRSALEAGAKPRSTSKNMKWVNSIMGRAPTDDCIEWPFSKRESGYGQIVWKYKRTTSHRVVCEIAHGAPEDPSYQAAHSCGNRSCCNPKHLSWKTPLENIHDKIDHGTQLKGEDIYCSKLRSRDVQTIKKLLREGRTVKSVAEEFSVSIGAISDIKLLKSWRHIDAA